MLNLKALGILSVILCLLLYIGDANAHAGPLNKLAVDACFEKTKSKACRYEGGHNDVYIGTCQYMGENLMCVRNQPIQPLDTSTKSTKPDHSHEDTQQ
ncbi:MAG: hypothetical protein ABJH06_02835 [Paraglaciecola sp.]|uniref:hypothetical protein n=2 Tax=Paraglaciecola sp. TaxID=1920173 RepID=UPI00329A5A76